MNSISTKQALPTKKSTFHFAGDQTMPHAIENRPFNSATPGLPILNVAFYFGSQSLNWSMELGDPMIHGQCDNSSPSKQASTIAAYCSWPEAWECK